MQDMTQHETTKAYSWLKYWGVLWSIIWGIEYYVLLLSQELLATIHAQEGLTDADLFITKNGSIILVYPGVKGLSHGSVTLRQILLTKCNCSLCCVAPFIQPPFRHVLKAYHILFLALNVFRALHRAIFMKSDTWTFFGQKSVEKLQVSLKTWQE